MTPQQQIRAAVEPHFPADTDKSRAWRTVMSLIELDARHPMLRLLEHASDGLWSPAAARAALAIERQLAMPGLAQLVARAEYESARLKERAA